MVVAGASEVVVSASVVVVGASVVVVVGATDVVVVGASVTVVVDAARLVVVVSMPATFALPQATALAMIANRNTATATKATFPPVPLRPHDPLSCVTVTSPFVALRLPVAMMERSLASAHISLPNSAECVAETRGTQEADQGALSCTERKPRPNQ